MSTPDVLVAMNEFSLKKFAHEVVDGGLVLYNGHELPEGFDSSHINVVCIPAGEIADVIGSAKAANIVMLGALLEATECLAPETAIHVLEVKVKKIKLLEVDRKAAARRSRLHGTSGEPRRSQSARWLRVCAAPSKTSFQASDWGPACQWIGFHVMPCAPAVCAVLRFANCSKLQISRE